MGHRKFKHTGFGEAGVPFKYGQRPAWTQQRTPWWSWLVTRILAAVLFMTLFIFFVSEAAYRYFLR